MLHPQDFTPQRVKDADALIVRTRTRIDEQLLAGSQVRLVATATIGYDHIDTDYCERAGIRWVSCPGCNAQAVCDYVEEAILECRPHIQSLGVVGVGHVGSKVVAMARRHGWKVVENDPPKGMMGDVSSCDVITYHVPLTHTGAYPTWHMCDSTFLQSVCDHALIINAARGGVVDEAAWSARGVDAVIDCWENEPDLNRQLLHHPHVLRSSFHIAGYSRQGKRNASQMCLDALSECLGLPQMQAQPLDILPPGDSREGWLERISQSLKSAPESFESLRKGYILR